MPRKAAGRSAGTSLAGIEAPTPAAAISEGGILYPAFHGPSWARWRAILKAANGEALDEAETVLFREVADRDPPSRRVRELWCIAGRWSGKDSIASGIAAVAALGDYRPHLRPGEVPVVLCLANTQEQADIVRKYTCAYFTDYPLLRPLIARETGDGLELVNGVQIVVGTNSFRAVRGRTVVVAILDEVGLWRTDAATQPDIETYTAVLPALARVQGSMLIGISTPYRRQGLLYERWQAAYGKPDDDVLVIRGRTQLFNPGADQRIIDRDMARDPEKAGAEWLAEWRNDLSDFLGRDLLDAATDHGVVVRPAQAGVTYFGFVDAAAGRGDAFTAAVAHAEGEAAVLDCLYERRPPFDPQDVVREVVEVLRDYGVVRVGGDRYAGNWVSGAFESRGIRYETSERDRSALYLDVLPLFTAGQVRLLDHPRLFHQLAALERRTSRVGKDRVDHPGAAGGADDLANSAAGALVLAAGEARPSLIPASALRAKDDAPAFKIGLCRSTFATCWVSQSGLCGMAWWAVRSMPVPGQPELVLMDVATAGWSPAVLDQLAVGLDVVAEQVRDSRAWNAEHGVSAILWSQDQLVGLATDAMRRAFQARLSRIDARLGRRAIGTEGIPAEHLRDPARLMLGASAAIGEGRIEFAPLVHERAKTIPVFGSLGVSAADDCERDPLRVALLLGVAIGLDAAPLMQAPDLGTARVQFR